jgi:hypothetical protein
MRPVFGVSIEILVLAALLSLGSFLPPGLLFGLYVVVAELAAAYLIHCPAHYFVGTILGVRFRSIRLGYTTLARSLPVRIRGVTRFLPLPTLSTDRSSLGSLSGRRAAAMYASGVAASVSSAIIVAAVATYSEPPLYAGLAWAVALLYLASDIVFSPKSGDLRKALDALGP